MTTSIDSFDEIMRRGGETAIRNVSSFFGQDGALLRTLVLITSRLNEMKVPFAIAGGLAMVAHGCPRTTMKIELVVTSQSLKQIHDRLAGAGY